MKKTIFLSNIGLTFSVLLFIFTSCKKEETKIITGNEPPSDSTIDIVYRKNFIEKSYLSIIGRSPSQLETTGALTILDEHQCSVSDREKLLDILFNMPDYRYTLYSNENSQLLASTSIDYVDAYIAYYRSINTDTTVPYYTLYLGYIEDLKTLKAGYRSFLNDSIDLVEVHRRMTGNIMYYNLNGSEFYWVRSAFPYFLKRKPTLEEVDNNTYMAYGYERELFNKKGKSIKDLLNIFFNSNEYFEGQVRTIFLKHLYREPSTSELMDISSSYKKDHNYILLLKRIFLSNEYLGKK